MSDNAMDPVRSLGAMTDRGEITLYGFKWGALEVERTSSLPEGRVVLTVKTDHHELTIYASKRGRSLRVFADNAVELRGLHADQL